MPALPIILRDIRLLTDLTSSASQLNAATTSVTPCEIIGGRTRVVKAQYDLKTRCYDTRTLGLDLAVWTLKTRRMLQRLLSDSWLRMRSRVRVPAWAPTTEFPTTRFPEMHHTWLLVVGFTCVRLDTVRLSPGANNQRMIGPMTSTRCWISRRRCSEDRAGMRQDAPTPARTRRSREDRPCSRSASRRPGSGRSHYSSRGTRGPVRLALLRRRWSSGRPQHNRGGLRAS
jgi:hypothetical protein